MNRRNLTKATTTRALIQLNSCLCGFYWIYRCKRIANADTQSKKESYKTTERKKEEYKEVISLLKRGYSVRNTAKLSNVSISTVQRVKREFSL